MTNEQLYLAIGLPILFNAALLYILKWGMDTQLGTLRDGMIDRFNQVDKRLDFLLEHFR